MMFLIFLSPWAALDMHGYMFLIIGGNGAALALAAIMLNWQFIVRKFRFDYQQSKSC